MRVRFTQTALNEIDAIFSYIAKDNRFAAAEILGIIEATIARLKEYPRMAVETNIPGVRVALTLPHPYLIFYSIENEALIVRNVRHAARRRPESPRS